MLVTIDTNLLIWGVRSVATAGQEARISQTREFLEYLDKVKDRVVLTSECVAEYLVGTTDEQRRRELVQLQSKYLILPYDAKAAVIAATLRSDKDFLRSLQDDVGKTRTCIKSDIIIVATAKAHQVERIYSNDAGVKALAAKCKLSVQDLPTHEELNPPAQTLPKSQEQQGSLFDDETNEKSTPS